jgi:hypothetical protein
MIYSTVLSSTVLRTTRTMRTSLHWAWRSIKRHLRGGLQALGVIGGEGGHGAKVSLGFLICLGGWDGRTAQLGLR